MNTQDTRPFGTQSRRDFLKACGAATAIAALPATVSAGGEKTPATSGALHTKPIPSSGERLPVVGLGTNAYGVTEPAEIAKRQAVIARQLELGAKVIDTARAYGDSELVVGRILADLGTRSQVFLATKTPGGGPLTNPSEVLEESFRRLRTDRIDLLQIHNMYGVEELLPEFRKFKDAKRVRYLGVTTSRDEQYPALLETLRKHPLDFVQVDYSIANRNAEAEVLPLAAGHGVAVLVNMPYGGRSSGNLLRKLSDRPLPGWAAELGAGSWAECLLKYVISHPAVTCAIPGTTSVANLETNLRAARGVLPDAALRRRMEQDWDKLAIA